MAAIGALLNDPCSAPLPPPFLPGERGMVTRLVFDGSIIGPANNSGYVAFHPNSGWVASAAAVTGATAIPANDFAINAANSPGFNFLSANASKVRGLAACITVLPASLSVTNIVGDIAVGSVSCDALRSIIGASHTCDNVASYTNARCAIERRGYEAKFKPSQFDDKYSTYQNTGSIAGTGSDLSDTSAILVVVRGVPTGTSINIRITWIVEWVPKFNLGLAASADQRPGSVNHMAVSAALDRKKSNWWHNLGHEVGGFVKELGKAAVQQGVHELFQAKGPNANMFMQTASSGYSAPLIEEVFEGAMALPPPV